MGCFCSNSIETKTNSNKGNNNSQTLKQNINNKNND